MGLVLYEMLYGFGPFEGVDEGDLVRNVKRREYRGQDKGRMGQFGVVVSRETAFLMDSLLDYYP